MARRLQRRIVLVDRAFTPSEALHAFGPGVHAEIALANQDGHYPLVWEERPNSLPERWLSAGAPAAKAKDA
eukprot:8524134-Alexandrium_andersonii.AAC.1